MASISNSGFDIIFFEIDAVNVDRYYLKIFEEILVDKQFLVLLEDPKEAKMLISQQPQLNVICIQDIAIKDLKDLFNNSSLFVINGQRIPDTYLTMIARQQKCEVCYIQHGFYVNEMKRGTYFYFNKMNKTLRYLSYALKSAQIDNNLILLFKLIRAHIFGLKRNYHFKKISGFPDIALVFSEYWKKWHLKHYFQIPEEQFELIGSPELNRFNTTKLPDNYITYCYQTILEDGRVSKDYFIAVLEDIIRKIETKGFSIVVKGHPRMSVEMIKFFEDKGMQVFFDVLPITKYVVGHYSSLLPLWVHYGCFVYSIELEGHDLTTLTETIKYTTLKVSLEEFDLEEKPNTELHDLQKAIKYYCNFDNSFKENLKRLEIFNATQA